jgi:hypothetical protein
MAAFLHHPPLVMFHFFNKMIEREPFILRGCKMAIFKNFREINVSRNIIFNKKFWEELIACLPLI